MKIKVGTLVDIATSFLGHVAGTLIIIAVLLVIADIVASKFLNQPIIWVTEVGGYGLVYITFLGTAYVLKNKGHVRIDLVLSRLHPRTQDLVNAVTSIWGAVVCLVTGWYAVLGTWHFFKWSYISPSVLELPLTPVVAVIPVGCFLLSIQFMRDTYSHFRKWRQLSQEGQMSQADS